MKQTVRQLFVVAALLLFSASALANADTVRMWIAAQPAEVNAWLEEFKREFNAQNPDIQLEIEMFVSVAELREKAIVATAAGIGPDVFYDASNNVNRWVVSGFATPLDEYMAAKEDMDDFIPEIFDLLRFKGKTYAFPFVMWPIFTLYNLDLFDQYGVDEPQTWDEMVAAARSLTQIDGSGGVMQFGWRTIGNNAVLALGDLQLTLEQLGSTMVEPHALSGDLTTPEAVRAMQYLLDLRQVGMPHSRGGNTMVDVLAGKVAIQHWASTSVGFLDTLRTAELQNLNLGMRRFVGPNPGEDVIVAFAGVMILSTYSQHPDKAWRVIEAFTEPKNMQAYLVGRQYNQTVRKSQATDPVILDLPYQMELMQLMRPPLTTSGSRHPFYTDFRQPVGEILVMALQGEAPINAALEEAERIMNNIIRAENQQSGILE